MTPFAGKAPRTRQRPSDKQEGRDPRRRTEPDRARHRVRLLLLPCLLRAEGCWLRDHHGQLQSGNRVDRLRHLGSPLFRAADRRRRSRNHRHRDARAELCTASSCNSADRRRSNWRNALEEAANVPILGTSPDMIDLAEDRDRFKKPARSSSSLKQPENGDRLFRHRRRRARSPDEMGLPDRDPAVLRARWPDHGGSSATIVHVRALPARHAALADPFRGQGKISQRQDRPDQHGFGQESAAVRPLSLGCHRGRCRLPERRQGRLHRRDHGAYRGSRHPFRRFCLLAATALALA